MKYPGHEKNQQFLPSTLCVSLKRFSFLLKKKKKKSFTKKIIQKD